MSEWWGSRHLGAGNSKMSDSNLCPHKAHHHPSNINQDINMKINIMKGRVRLSPNAKKRTMLTQIKGRFWQVRAWRKIPWKSLLSLETCIRFHPSCEGQKCVPAQCSEKVCALPSEDLGTSLMSASDKLDGLVWITLFFGSQIIFLEVGRFTANNNGLLY